MVDISVGPGRHTVQGVASRPDEGQADKFRQAALVHLTMPGVINLRQPQESSFELSEGEYEPGRLALKPVDIRSQGLAAGLVFLSSIRVTGEPHSEFTSRPALISDFLTAGADAVVVNLWSGDAGSNEKFVTEFYHGLKESGNIAEALRSTKLSFLKNNREKSLNDWAGYQLYIR